MESEATYSYDPLPEEEWRGKYCAAPRHGATRVQARWIEKYRAPALGVTEDVIALACNDCHDSMLQAFLDDMLPEATAEELTDAEMDTDYYEDALKRILDA